jgi:hypothetical protein
MSPVAFAVVSHCPSCGRPIRQPRQNHPSAEPAPVDTSRMSDADVYRYYRRTAPIEDLRFFLRHAHLSPELRTDADALLALGCLDTGGALSRLDWYRRLTALQDRWRRDTAAVRLPDVSVQMAEAV